MPWFAIQQDSEPADIYDLDYTGMIFPVVLIQSVKRRHFLVLVAAAVSITLKLQIALSSSIFQSALIPRLHPVSVQILDTFSGDADDTSPPLDSFAYVTALEQFSGSLPFGVSPDCAYQTYTSLDPHGKPLQTEPGEPLIVTVDGLFAETECILLDSYEASWQHTPWSESKVPMLELRFEDCEETFRIMPSASWVSGRAHSIAYMDEKLGNNKTCRSLPQQNRQFVWVVTGLSEPAQEGSPLHVDNCEAVLCSSSAWTSKVQIVDDGIRREVSSATDAGANTTFDFDPWRLFLSTSAIWTTLKTMDWEDPVEGMNIYLPVRQESSDDILRRSQKLRTLVQEMTRNYTSMIVHNHLRMDVREQRLGTKMQTVSRMEANTGVCISMSILSACCAGLSFYVMCISRSHFGCHRDPATIMGSIIHICGRTGRPREFQLFQRGSRSKSKTWSPLKTAWSQGIQSPVSLTLGLRAVVVVFTLGLILGLSLTLQRSREYNGLLNVGGEDYWALVWQSLPTLTMLIVSLYSTSSDTALRGLATVSETSNKSQSSTELDMSLLDMLGVRAIYHSINLGIPAVTLLQFLSTLCGFLPAISSVLLATQKLPHVAHVSVGEESWFGSRLTTEANFQNLVKNRRSLANLVLLREIANFTSPRYTYRDLIFPKFEIRDSMWGRGASAQVKMSAAKLSPTCARLSEGEFDIHYELLKRESNGDTDDSGPIPIPEDEFDWDMKEEDLRQYYFDVQMTQYIDCPGGTQRNVSWNLLSTNLHEGSAFDNNEPMHFGLSMWSLANPLVRHRECNGGTRPNQSNLAWIDRIYVWGRLQPNSRELDHLSAWRCNYTWVDVETDLHLLWSEEGPTIDHNTPPAWDESTSRPWTPPFSVPVLDSDMLESDSVDEPMSSVFMEPGPGPVENNYDVMKEFGYILMPYGQVTVEDLGSPDTDEQILHSLHAGVTFAAAQLANIERRLSLDETSDSSSPTDPNQHSREPISVNITDHKNQRVVQNLIITFIMIAILSVVAAVHIWALISGFWQRSSKLCRKRPWLLDLELRGVAPPDFSSINVMAALLEGSNCADVLPADAHSMPAEELHRHLEGKEFRLGWFYNTKTDTDVYTIGVLNEGDLVFKHGRL